MRLVLILFLTLISFEIKSFEKKESFCDFNINEYIHELRISNYVEEIISSTQDTGPIPGWSGSESGSSEDADELYDEAVNFVIESRRASISAVQRKLRIGYNRAARIIDQMENNGAVSKANHTGKREVL